MWCLVESQAKGEAEWVLKIKKNNKNRNHNKIYKHTYIPTYLKSDNAMPCHAMHQSSPAFDMKIFPL